MSRSTGRQFMVTFATLIVMAWVVIAVAVLVHLTALGIVIAVFVVGLPITLYPGLHSMQRNRRRMANRGEHEAN